MSKYVVSYLNKRTGIMEQVSFNDLEVANFHAAEKGSDKDMFSSVKVVEIQPYVPHLTISFAGGSRVFSNLYELIAYAAAMAYGYGHADEEVLFLISERVSTFAMESDDNVDIDYLTHFTMVALFDDTYGDYSLTMEDVVGYSYNWIKFAKNYSTDL